MCTDAKLLTGAIELDMSAVTGESAPVLRSFGGGDVAVTPSRVVDAPDVVLSGTSCTSGEAHTVVVHAGMSTELGRIATSAAVRAPRAVPSISRYDASPG